MSAQFPTVPALPGVPPLARLGTAAQVAAGATISGETQALAAALGLPPTVTFGTAQLFSGLGLQSLNSQSTPQPENADQLAPGALPPYGITGSDNSAVISPDSVVEFETNADSNVNSHPIELGGFQAFNRVQEPISIRMLLSCQGKQMSRETFITTLKSLREGTQIVTISTPDTTYPNMTLKGFAYKKTAEHGAVTIWADTQWTEERSTNVTVSAPPTSQPQGAATTSLGSLQPGTPTSQQQASISNPPVPPAPLPPGYSNTAPPSGDGF
jgi:hypothetical protein